MKNQPKNASVCVNFNASYSTTQAQEFLQKLNALMGVSENAKIVITKGVQQAEETQHVAQVEQVENSTKVATFEKIIYNLFNREKEDKHANALGRFVLNHTSNAERMSKRWSNVCKARGGVNYNLGDVFEVVMTKKLVERTGLHIKSDGDCKMLINGDYEPVEIKLVSTRTKADFKETKAKYHLIGFNNGNDIIVKLLKTSEIIPTFVDVKKKNGEIVTVKRIAYKGNVDKGVVWDI